MIRRARYILAAAGSAAILAGGMALAGAGAASAASLPSCATGVNCTDSNPSTGGGTAGYYGADDNHTHYRFVQTVTEATPQLVLLNGVDFTGSTGVTLCDPNTGQVAQISLGFTGAGHTGYQVRYTVGKYMTSASEPCIQNANAFVNILKTGHVLSFPGINGGDKIYLAIYYAPSGPHFHQLSFGACDITQSVCRQAYFSPNNNLTFWEFGIGAFTGYQFLTAPPNNPLDVNTLNEVTCYSCAGPVGIATVSPVNPFGIGGLYEAQLINFSSQPTMSPNDSLSASTSDFGIWNGSTSP